jgi:PAS domain S-box-containing protein
LAEEQCSSSPDFQALAEEARDLIDTLDLQGRITYFNRGSRTSAGLSGGADMPGVSFLKIPTPASAMLAKQHFAQALAGRVSTPCIEVEAKHRDSGIVNLEIRSGAIVRDGVRCGRHGIARNITEIKSLQAMVAKNPSVWKNACVWQWGCMRGSPTWSMRIRVPAAPVMMKIWSWLKLLCKSSVLAGMA